MEQNKKLTNEQIEELLTKCLTTLNGLTYEEILDLTSRLRRKAREKSKLDIS